MSSLDARALPLDPDSAAALAATGLELTLIDTDDPESFDEWIGAETRGFHEGAYTSSQLAEVRAALGYRRTTSIVDPASPSPTAPVGTVSSWPTELTVSASRTLQTWAISSVTVSPTHAGRGIARAMLEGELRTAASAGLALAALTVTEAPLYGRYGFAPAVMTGDWQFDTARAKWTGPEPRGTVELIGPTEWRAGIDDLYERVRLQNAGHIEAWGRRWDEKAGLTDASPERSRLLRAARYTDEAGQVRGLMLYRIPESDDFTSRRLVIDHLTTDTDDAAAALWRLALTMPLVRVVEAPMRRLDEPVRWQIADWRAATLSPRDNLWLRILDVPAALTSRRWESPGTVVLRISDPLGLAAGTWRLTADANGDASVVAVSDSEADAEEIVSLGVAELSAAFLGAVSLESLARAGRVQGEPAVVTKADGLMRTAAEPWLPFWF
jgi:predicted acetyltransferase